MTAVTFGQVPVRIFRGTAERLDRKGIKRPRVGKHIIVRYGVHLESGMPYVYYCVMNGEDAWHHFSVPVEYFSRETNEDKNNRLSLEEQKFYLQKYCRHFDAKEKNFILVQGFPLIFPDLLPCR